MKTTTTTTKTRKLNDLLKAYSSKNKKDNDRVTHTRIPDKENKIYGGKYIVTEENEQEFYRAAFEETTLGSKMEYLTERQYIDGPMYVDIDLRYAHSVATRQHDDEWTEDLIGLYLSAMKEYFEFDPKGEEKFVTNVYVLQKDGVNRLTDGSATKDGIHILFGVNVPRKVQMLIRESVINEAEELFSKLPVTNDLEKIFDDGITKGTTNVQMFGCRKPAHEAYKFHKRYRCELDTADKEWMIHCDTPEMTPELFWELSVRNTERPVWNLNKETKQRLDPMLKIREKREKSKQEAEWADLDNTDPNDIEKLFQCFTAKRIDEYSTWTQICWAIVNSVGKEQGGPLVEKLNEYCPNRNTKEDKAKAREWFDNLEPKTTGDDRVTIRSLHYWAREDNLEKYKELFPAVVKSSSLEHCMKAVIDDKTEYAFAVYIKEATSNKFVCTNKKDKIFYVFTDKKLWTEDKGGTAIRQYTSNEINSALREKEQEAFEEANALDYEGSCKEEQAIINAARNKAIAKAEGIKTIRLKTEQTCFKNNVLTETCDLLIDVDFLNDMNKEQFVLPLKSGKLLNMETLVVTERTIANKFNYECDVNYIENLTDEQTTEAKKYFLDLFCGREDTCQVFLNIIKSVMTGRPLRYVYFLVGSGRNGKSVLLNLLRSIFKKGVDVISKDVILRKKSNTEMEKLGKCRLAYTTEFKEEDKLNETNLKAITGKDAINVRGIQRTDETMEATSNLFVISNELPSFDVEPAVCDRIIVVPFNAKFPVVDNFEDKIIANRDIMFSYIMKYGVLQDKFELTDEMKAATEEYKKANEKDYLTDFLNKFYVVTDEMVAKDKPMKIERDSLKVAYKQYLRDMNENRTNISNTKLTKTVKAFFKIETQESNGRVYYLGIKSRPPEATEDTSETMY